VLGRERRWGETNNKSKANADEVAEARRLLDQGVPKKEVAAKFGHHLCWAYRIANRETRVNG
jgi:DNA invertase Pin-like site-specific DNA recombinase